MSVNEQRLKEILSPVAAKCYMKDWCYRREEKRETIENYMGVLIPVTVIAVSEDKEFSQHVYVKLPLLEGSLRVISGYMFDVEAYVYCTLVPLWKRFSNVKVDELIPQCYFADATPNYQTLVLKDMRYEGFLKYNEAFLDYEHVLVSLRSLAEFHALSFIIKKETEDLNSSVLRPYTGTYPPALNDALQNSFRRHFHLFKGSKYEHYWEVTFANYITVVNEGTLKAKCLVVGHFDYWKGNIMYKYQNNIPVKACMFDFQTCQVMTPAHDFLFFILNSTRGSLRRIHYNYFLSEYYAALKNILFDHGIQLDLFYTKEDFISDLKIVSPFCFLRFCMAFSLWLGFETDGLVKSKNSWENNQQREKDLGFLKDLYFDAMDDLCNYGYICL